MPISNETLKAIQDATVAQVVDIDGTSYVTRAVHDPRTAEPAQVPLRVASLAGLVEYIVTHERTDAVVHVADFDRVDIVTLPFGHFKQRDTLATAKAQWPDGLHFGRFMDLELFNVQLQSLFVATPERAAVLAVTGNVVDEATLQTEDDGVTQKTTAKTGIARVGSVKVPSPALLAPFRTFRDIEQPESPFVLRIKSGTPPQAALYEADGGMWKLHAISLIKAWLTKELPEGYPVIG